MKKGKGQSQSPSASETGTSLPLEVKIPIELAIACYRAGRAIFDAFILWLELRCFNQALIGQGYLNGCLPYELALAWLLDRGWDLAKAENLIRTFGVFFKVEWRQRKPPILWLKGFTRVCQHFHVVPVSNWRRVPLAEFTNGRRRSAVRAAMALPATDAPKVVLDKPRAQATKRARTGVPERTHYFDKKRLKIEGSKNWVKNNGDDFDRYPVYQFANHREGFGLTGRAGRILHVQVAMTGTSRHLMGAGKFLRLLRRRCPRRYFETQNSLQRALNKQDEQDSRGVPSGLASSIIPRVVHEDPVYLVSRSDRLRKNAREWARASEEVVIDI